MNTYLAGSTATLTVQWAQSPGGPAVDVTGQTITIKTAAGATVVAATSVGIVHLATGLYSYQWAIPSGQAEGDYVAIWDATDPQLDAVQASEVFAVVAANTLLYATLVELKARIGNTVSADDAELLGKLVTASRKVDEDTNRAGRGFGLDAVASPRVYEPTHATVLLIDELSTSAGVVVEVGLNTSWSLLDPNGYEFRPENCFARGRPANSLRRLSGAWPLYFGPGSYLQQRIRVTGVWGWLAVPPQIKEATLIRAQRLFRRKGSPEGVAGFGDFGPVRVSRFDSDYNDLISDFILDEM